MNKDRKAHNSTLRPLSLKNQAERRGKKPPPRKGFKKPTLEEIAKRFKVVTAAMLGEKPRKKMKHRSKGPSGEKALFVDMFRRSDGCSEIDGTPLIPPPDGDGPEYDLQWKAFLSQWSHILPKGSYPKWRLIERNIVRKTVEQHRMWEQEKRKLRDLPEWRWVFELEESLKREANGVIQ